MVGRIIKGIGGFYYIKTDSGIIEARGRGSFKNEGITLTVGDMAEFDVIDAEKGKGVINSILPRKNSFIRPQIANVDCFAVVFAAAKPDPSFELIDKFLIMAEMNDVDAIIIINKADLVDSDVLDGYRSIYKGIYPVIALSAKDEENDGPINEIKRMISGRTTAFAGASGVGKSTIINRLVPHANMETGAVSAKTQRGRHTTRHAEIFEADGGGLVFDTPGFTSFDIMEADEESLMLYYPEIEKLRCRCRYDNCKHMKEPECAVRAAVKDGTVSRIRYDSYITNLEAIKNRKKY